MTFWAENKALGLGVGYELGAQDLCLKVGFGTPGLDMGLEARIFFLGGGTENIYEKREKAKIPYEPESMGHRPLRTADQKLSAMLDQQCTDRTLIRSEEGPKGLAAPSTAHMAQVIFSLPVAVDTIGGYNWRHHGDF